MNDIRDREKTYKVVGPTVLIDVAGITDIPAKVDTGADTSAIWASNINMSKDGILSFTLFSPKSPMYTGEIIKTREYRIKVVRSSHGDEQIRYRVKLPVCISGVEFETTFTLADRTRNHFPVLIGRHTLENQFVVDVSKEASYRKPQKSPELNRELRDNPYEFHQKYFKRKEQK